jgi:hypothetical protein
MKRVQRLVSLKRNKSKEDDDSSVASDNPVAGAGVGIGDGFPQIVFQKKSVYTCVLLCVLPCVELCDLHD